MRVILTETVVHDGAVHPPGVELSVPAEIGARLIKTRQALVATAAARAELARMLASQKPAAPRGRRKGRKR